MSLDYQSRCRRQQYQWLEALSQNAPSQPVVLDLGGVSDADYHRYFPIVTVWNNDPSTGADVMADLDDVKSLPAFPAGCKTVLAMNLLEHLYRPLELVQWACRNLPSGGTFVAAVPFLYRIHPSPSDFWRMTPEVFDRCFEDLERQGVLGQWRVDALGDDLRDLISPITADMFKGSRRARWVANGLEKSAGLASLFLSVLGYGAKVREWAQYSPVALGIRWIKS